MLLALLLASFADDVIGSARDPLGPGGMRYYALAFGAYAMVNDRDLSAHARLIEAMRAERFVTHFTGAHDPALRAKSAVAGGHLLLALTGGLIAGDASAEHRELARSLAHAMAAEIAPGRLLPSYLQEPRRLWPADNEVVLAALSLYGARFSDAPSVSAAAMLRATLDRLGERGLPASEIDPVTGRKQAPRGCALSQSVAMRGLHDPPAAAALYARYRGAHWDTAFGLAGFREWPRGTSGVSDADSGPIVLGIGASASALALGAARLAGAKDDFAALDRSASVATWILLDANERKSVLAQAILRFGRSARRW